MKSGFKKNHVVTYRSGGSPGVIKWLGNDRGGQVAVVRWDSNGALVLVPTDLLKVSVIALSAEKRIVRTPRQPSSNPTETER